ncbi:hypothetical protein ACIO6T_38080 [Streptomyces sp. NPDC087532]|uniref:hypothetical protein n=1 Tax=Streptomyces sp. NPDC087532 TaxID=3365795 RepID=UPI003811A6BD
MDAVSVPGTSRFDLPYLDALVRQFAAEQWFPSSLWGKREGRSLADWQGERDVLVPLLEELMVGLRHWADHVPGAAVERRAWSERLQGGLELLSMRAREAVPDPLSFLEGVIVRYREEVSEWQAQPDPPQGERALISLSRAGVAGEPTRAEVYSDSVTAVLEFLHRDCPGHRVRIQLHEPGRPAQPLPAADLWQRAVRSATLGTMHVIDSYRLQWLRHRLAERAPAASYRAGSPVRDRWVTAAVDWALTFKAGLTAPDVEAALDQDASPHDGAAQHVLDEYHPVHASELSAPGAIDRPVPSDWRQLTNDWSTRAPEALAVGEGPVGRGTAELASALAILEPQRAHPDGAAGQAADEVLTELTWRFPRAQELRVLLGPEESDVDDPANAANNPYLAPAWLDPARQRMRNEADQQARQLTAEHYAVTSDGAAAAEAEAMVQTMLRPPGEVLNALASVNTDREVAGARQRSLRHDPHGMRWRAEHPRSAAALTNRSMEAARASIGGPAGRASARGAYERAQTSRLEALHAMLGRLQAHRPDPIARDSWAERRTTATRAFEVEQMLDRAAVLAAFPTFQAAHLHVEGVIETLHLQITQTMENLAQAARSLRGGDQLGHDGNGLGAHLYAGLQIRENAKELRSLIEVCNRLDEISPATIPTSRLRHQELYADAERITLSQDQPTAAPTRHELPQPHGAGHETVHRQGQAFTGRQP